MDKFFLKPKKKELTIFKPDGSRLSAEGEMVEASTFWHRRLKDGEVEIIKTPKLNNKDK